MRRAAPKPSPARPRPARPPSNSCVLRAVCRATGAAVAIKVFDKAALSAKEAVHAGREVFLMGILRDDPGVVELLGAFEDAARGYAVMELCAGRDLYHRAVLEARLPEAAAAAGVIGPLLRTLRRLHEEHSVVHRDIKVRRRRLPALLLARQARGAHSHHSRPSLPPLPRSRRTCS